MPVKAKQNEEALSVVDMGSGFNPMSSIVEPERASFLPTIKLVHPNDAEATLPVLGPDGKPMVANGKPLTQHAAGRVVITAGKGKIQPLSAPYILTAWCIRGATRKWPGEKFERTFASIKGEPNAKHEAALDASKDAQSSGVYAGNVALLIALTNDGKAAVGTLDMFKTQVKYWGEVLKQGLMFNDGDAVQINIDDHTPNIALSGNGFKYYSYAKFNQWNQTKLTADQKGLIKDLMRDNQKPCDEWLNRNE